VDLRARPRPTLWWQIHIRSKASCLRPAVRVSAVVERIDPDEDVLGAEDLRPPERVREENGVARRHIGDGNPVREGLRAPSLGDREVGRQRGGPEGAEVDLCHEMPDRTEASRHGGRGRELCFVTLPVTEAERERGNLVHDQGRRNRDPTQQDNGRPVAHARNIHVTSAEFGGTHSTVDGGTEAGRRSRVGRTRRLASSLVGEFSITPGVRTPARGGRPSTRPRSRRIPVLNGLGAVVFRPASRASRSLVMTSTASRSRPAHH
jgi:hypothetical protein